MKDIIGNIVVGVPLLNEVTNQGIITALELGQYSWFGMTWGAWFKVGMFIALILLVVERALSILQKWKTKTK